MFSLGPVEAPVLKAVAEGEEALPPASAPDASAMWNEGLSPQLAAPIVSGKGLEGSKGCQVESSGEDSGSPPPSVENSGD
mmetsp:Transcript_23499/g.35493  ORF Transcript_23499/g.35493 Transcript_23499/m.35493 type:complete len:80 (+) Transcript_23499:183-422(+)|eukprot:CAMPEP_0194752204 /NCGR_PEP_ID=MMETSP0323_2-20130528/6018_1 /TAXON_ID=2866 ORGANISM="Crypthecodinium cohnii, Strain Seligo" /NCGR_SAMPLE_ID=MMETSP0323_2 /ASSEMBLY_ACC=CAM_ASM_000346 /LENGTH=79 /DNA_ID=CAMNT_0039668977 /DNA_START=155 /DNA_END=394 /DNA_ORIENTATION=+